VIDYAGRGWDLVEVARMNAAGQPGNRCTQGVEITGEGIAAAVEAPAFVEAATLGWRMRVEKALGRDMGHRIVHVDEPSDAATI
jgi:hypothetical protein